MEIFLTYFSKKFLRQISVEFDEISGGILGRIPGEISEEVPAEISAGKLRENSLETLGYYEIFKRISFYKIFARFSEITTRNTTVDVFPVRMLLPVRKSEETSNI